MRACQTGDLLALRTLVETQHLTLNDLRVKENLTLIRACHGGHLPIVKGAAQLIQ